MNPSNTIFVLGYPRSGTTWFANLFNSHPDVVYRQEIIGRCHSYFSDLLFRNLKYNGGLQDDEYQEALDIVLSPNVESDRAPFFPKNHLNINSVQLHYLIWLAAKTLKLLSPFYKHVFHPNTNDLSLVIKETRSTVNIDSIIAGLRAEHIVILFRHPCAVISSNLRGIDTGKMSTSTDKEKVHWYRENYRKPYLNSLKLTEDDLTRLPEHRYQAIVWAQQNEDYITLTSTFSNCHFVSYEAFMADKKKGTQQLFSLLPLSYEKVVEEFILATSCISRSRVVRKDSFSTFHSIYRDNTFDPGKWKTELTVNQKCDIQELTFSTYDKLLEHTEESV